MRDDLCSYEKDWPHLLIKSTVMLTEKDSISLHKPSLAVAVFAPLLCENYQQVSLGGLCALFWPSQSQSLPSNKRSSGWFIQYGKHAAWKKKKNQGFYLNLFWKHTFLWCCWSPQLSYAILNHWICLFENTNIINRFFLAFKFFFLITFTNSNF